MKAGDKIRLARYFWGQAAGTEDFKVEEFRFCLGIFKSAEHKKMDRFTPLCELYESGPESENCYMPNEGDYVTNMVPSFMNLPKD
jgi:hypothetical protein